MICICYWVSVLIIVRSFTVRFETRIHLTSLFWFNNEFSFSVFHRTTVMVLPIYKCAFRPPLINIIYAPLLWVLCPKSRTIQMCFSSSFNQHHLCTAIMGIVSKVAYHINVFFSSSIELRTVAQFQIKLPFVRSCPNAICVTDIF